MSEALCATTQPSLAKIFSCFADYGNWCSDALKVIADRTWMPSHFFSLGFCVTSAACAHRHKSEPGEGRAKEALFILPAPLPWEDKARVSIKHLACDSDLVSTEWWMNHSSQRVGHQCDGPFTHPAALDGPRGSMRMWPRRIFCHDIITINAC